MSIRNKEKAAAGAAPRGRVEAAGPLVNEAGEPVTVLPVIEEAISVSKQRRVTGTVRLTKTVREEEAVVDEPLLTERVVVERVSMNRPVSEIPSPRQENDTLVLPVVEEVLVVEKRLVLKEEVRIRRIREERHEPQRIAVRREQLKVERREGKPEKDK